MSMIALRQSFEVMDDYLVGEAKRLFTAPGLVSKASAVSSLFHQMEQALKACEMLRNSLAQASVQPGRTAEWIKGIKWTLFSEAKKEILSTMAQVKIDSSQLKEELRKLAMPKKPDGVSDAMILDRKSDLLQILQAAGSPFSTSIKAVDLARQAVVDADLLSQYCLASGPLHLSYILMCDKPAELEAQLSAVTASGEAGTALQWWSGRDGISAAVIICDNLLYSELGDIEHSIG